MECKLLCTRYLPRFVSISTQALAVSKPFTAPKRHLFQCIEKSHPSLCRKFSSSSTVLPSSPASITSLPPVKEDLDGFHNDIVALLRNDTKALNETCQSYFDGKGKSLRPATVFLMARMCNHHTHQTSNVDSNQRKVAMIAEMIHVGSLMHDDVVDASNVRRGKATVNYLLGDKNAIMAGNFVVSTASVLLSTINNHQVSKAMSTITKDLVDGEIMQQTDEDHFDHYLKKTYKKTASLFANCCKSVALLSGVNEQLAADAFEYGVNLGTAFQLVDDILDFVSSADMLGKPAVADLKLGLATAPVLFAREKNSQLDVLIRRRFKNDGDVDCALKTVLETDSLSDSRMLAHSYCERAKKNLRNFDDCHEKDLLLQLPQIIYERSS